MRQKIINTENFSDPLGDLAESVKGAFGLAFKTLPEYLPVPFQFLFTAQKPIESDFEKVKFTLPLPKA